MPADYGTVIGGGGPGGGGGSSEVTPTDDSFSVGEDTTLTGNVLDNDDTTVGSLHVRGYRLLLPGFDFESSFISGESVAIGGRGTFTLERNGDFEFVPAANFSGDIPEVEYEVTNGHEIKISTLNITVTAVNDGPTAGDAAGLSFEGEAIELDMTSFATDPDGDTLTLTHLNGVAVSVGVPVTVTFGTLTYLGANIVEIAPDSDDRNSIEFTYTVSDGSLSDTGDCVVQIGVDNIPLLSPFSPLLGNDMDQAAFNFGKTYRRKYGPTDDNGVDVSTPPYSAGQGYIPVDIYNAPIDREPWLYDRATTLYVLAKRTNNPQILAEAMNLARRYFAGVVLQPDGRATFNIIGNTGGDPQDVKYLYGIVAHWYERETLAAGGTTEEAQIFRTKARGLYLQTLQSFTQQYNGGTAELWTERNSWAAIMNCLSWYWISGEQGALDDAIAYVEDVISLSEATGAPQHSKDKHESDGDPTLVISTWMVGLLAEAILQVGRTVGPGVLSVEPEEWLSNLGDWMISNAFYTATGSEEPELIGLAGNRLAAYLAGTGVQFPEGEAADMEHCCDVAEIMRKVRWAKQALSLSTTAVDALIIELEDNGVVSDLYWTRFTVGYPKYRVNPPRKNGWQRRCRYSYVHSIGLVPFPPSLTTAPLITGSTQQGSELSVSDGIWAGTPTPTFTYQWLRDTVALTGETNDTYTTVEDDIGTTVQCDVTATNTGGSLTARSSNGKLVVTAGAPEITVQPSNASALEGTTANFTITATGSPSPSYQWQVNSGGGWANVAEGTGGTTNSYTTETLATDDNGDLYRCVVTNTGGSVTSDQVALTLVVQQEAVAFTDSTDYGTLTVTIGGAGFTGLTLAGWFYRGNVVNSGQWLTAEGAASRHVDVGYSNSGVPTISDSQTGPGTGSFDVDPPEDAWFFLVMQFPSVHPGTYRVTWYEEDGTLGGTATKSNGIEDSLTVILVHLNGGLAVGNFGCQLRAQHVRGYSRVFSDAEAEAEYANTNMADPDLEFFNVFTDNGGGGVAVTDASGNNLEFVLTGATLSTDGPVAPTV